MSNAAAMPSPPASNEAQTPDPAGHDGRDVNGDVDMKIENSSPVLPNSTAHDEQSPQAKDEEIGAREAREPVAKDISLKEFLSKMDDYAPIIPDAVTAHHLLLAGLDPAATPLPLQRLLALATQKFIADIAADAYQYSRMRGQGVTTNSVSTAALNAEGTGNAAGPAARAGGKDGMTSGVPDKVGKGPHGHILGVQRAGYGGGGASSSSQSRAVLTMEDLGCAVGEYGVNIRRGEFYR